MGIKNDAPGMRGPRSRNHGDGQLRDKRDDTYVATIERQYGRDFGARGAMQLGTLLRRTGHASLNDLIHSPEGRKK